MIADCKPDPAEQGREFVGHKRRDICRACAKPQGEAN